MSDRETSTEHVPPPRLRWGHILVPLGTLACLLPRISAGEGLLAGVLLAMAVGNPYLAWTRRAAHRLLTLAVMGLGAGMNLGVVARVGLAGIGYTVAGIVVCLALGRWLARVLVVSGVVGTLISVGTAICGGSAIAAMVPVLGPKEHEVSVALATVFLLNAVALFVFPPAGHALGLSQSQFGLWCALAIHDTSSVVGAALAYGAKAVEVATTVKLARALWIAPLTLAVGALVRRGGPRPARGEARRPWFILGFLLAAAAVTFFPVLGPAGRVVSGWSRQALVVTLFFIGTNLSRAALRSVGLRPLAQGFLLWLSMGGLTLGGIRFGLIR